MSAALYWKERLLTGLPFASSEMYIEGLNFKPNRKDAKSPWPHSLARSAMYSDYCRWHRASYLPDFQDEPYYVEHPEDLPSPADELGFFSTLGPWLYVVGKSRQVRSYAVVERVFQAGEWHDVRRKRYFVRLCGIEVHRAAFELYTGSELCGASPDAKFAMGVVSEAQRECRETTEKNRASMPNVP